MDHHFSDIKAGYKTVTILLPINVFAPPSIIPKKECGVLAFNVQRQEQNLDKIDLI